MIGAVAAGLLAAVVVNLPPWIQALLGRMFSPMMVPGVAALAMVLQRFVLDRRSGGRGYDGRGGSVHPHPFAFEPGYAPALGSAGPQLAAARDLRRRGRPRGRSGRGRAGVALAIRPRSARWFEQRRRTDTATALAAGVSAAFGAPFAGFLLPIELGLGGRAISAVVASLTALSSGACSAGPLAWACRDFAGNGLLYGFADSAE